MDSQALYAILAEALPEAELKINVGEVVFCISRRLSLEGLTSVRGSNSSINLLMSILTDGEIHAVTMQLQTPSEKLVSEPT